MLCLNVRPCASSSSFGVMVYASFKVRTVLRWMRRLFICDVSAAYLLETTIASFRLRHLWLSMIVKAYRLCMLRNRVGEYWHYQDHQHRENYAQV